MPDILIRGMELPKNEPLRIVLNPNGQLFVDHGVTFTEYEAVELPEHGDLIDRDAVFNGEADIISSDGYYAEFGFSRDMLRCMPAIVPSNKEETE